MDFWDAVQRGQWEKETFDRIYESAGEGREFIDIGAWIGPFTLFSAACGGKVTSYEPDPVAYARLAENLSLNPQLKERVTLYLTAVSDRRGFTLLYARSPSGCSGSSLLPVIKDQTLKCQTESLRSVLERARPETLVKMDIEGYEYQLLPQIGQALALKRIRFWISFHPGFHLSLTGLKTKSLVSIWLMLKVLIVAIFRSSNPWQSWRVLRQNFLSLRGFSLLLEPLR